PDAKAIQVAVDVRHAAPLDSLDLRRCDAQTLRQLGERHLDPDVLPQPADRNSHRQNWRNTRRSGDQSGRTSEMLKRSCAARSRPQPNANPLHFSGSSPTFSKTAGSTIPAPPSSVQPVNLH